MRKNNDQNETARAPRNICKRNRRNRLRTLTLPRHRHVTGQAVAAKAMAKGEAVPSLGQQAVRDLLGAPELLQGELGLVGHIVHLVLRVLLIFGGDGGELGRAERAVEHGRRDVLLGVAHAVEGAVGGLGVLQDVGRDDSEERQTQRQSPVRCALCVLRPELASACECGIIPCP